MKTTGIARPIDHLGRMVIPMELRRTMHIPEGTMMEIIASPDKDTILMRPCRLQCICCGDRNEAARREKAGVLICLSCLDTMMSDLPVKAKKATGEAATSTDGK